MFEVTFLGHQGWLVATSATALLIDPLLTERFGHGGHVGEVYPPRRIDLGRFPPIDAVVLTHEHDDHFDIPSLNRLSRSIPIYLSARSSAAARELLQQMGFAAHVLHSDQTLAVGDLRYRSFCADHRGARNGDEWDVFPFLVYDADCHGSLLSSIDVVLPDGMVEQLSAMVPRPGIWAYANNSTSSRVQDAGGPAHALPSDNEALARVASRRYEQVAQAWGPPAATLICGGGWSFAGERAWLNHHVFPLDAHDIRTALIQGGAAGEVVVPNPGTCIATLDGRLHAIEPKREFIGPRAPECWPSRVHKGDGARLGDYGPACGRRELSAAERQGLPHELEDLARHLYGTPVFQQICSLPSGDTADALPTVALALRTSASLLVLRYDPTGCRFVEHEGDDPLAEFMSGIECWATDLLALLRGEIGPTALCYAGRLRVWNHDARRLHVSAHLLWMFAHPLRRPAAAAALYQKLWRDEPSEVPQVRGRAAPGLVARAQADACT